MLSSVNDVITRVIINKDIFHSTGRNKRAEVLKGTEYMIEIDRVLKKVLNKWTRK